jgi:hypothetical protein
MAILRCIVALTLLTVAVPSNNRSLRATSQSNADCVARLDGGAFPHLVPEYSVWEELFQRVQAAKGLPTLADIRGELQLSETGMNLLTSASTVALNRASALRSSPFPPNGIPQKTAAADMIFESRDDLLRSLSQNDLQQLADHIDLRRRQTLYAFQRPGRRATSSTQSFNCPISISGKVDAELIPETYYWEFHFRVLASISEKHRVGPNKYDADYMATLREQRLPIPETDIVLVLQSALQAITAVDGVRANGSISDVPGREVEVAVAETIRIARLGLLRKLPKSSWVVVQRDAANRRGGIIYDFPTSF